MYSFSLNKAGQTSIFKKFFKKNYTGKNLHDLILVLKLVIPKEDYNFLTLSITSIKNKEQFMFHNTYFRERGKQNM